MKRFASSSSLAPLSTLPATSAMTIAKPFGAIANTTPWVATTLTPIRRVALSSFLPRFGIRTFRRKIFPQHRIALGTARAGNAIGGGDWTSNQLIPDLMRSFLAGESCAIRNPLAIRPWQFVLEPVRGYLMLAERLAQDPAKFSSGWNFGPAEETPNTVSWIADHLCRTWAEQRLGIKTSLRILMKRTI